MYLLTMAITNILKKRIYNANFLRVQQNIQRYKLILIAKYHIMKNSSQRQIRTISFSPDEGNSKFKNFCVSANCVYVYVLYFYELTCGRVRNFTKFKYLVGQIFTITKCECSILEVVLNILLPAPKITRKLIKKNIYKAKIPVRKKIQNDVITRKIR